MLAHRQWSEHEWDPVLTVDADVFSQPDLARMLAAGFAATIVMTAVAYLGPVIGIPNLDIAGILGAMLFGEVPRLFSSGWWAGMGWHFINGVILFPIVFVFLFLPAGSDTTHSHQLTRGALWGIALWLLVQLVVMPMMDGGFFSRNTLHPMPVVLGSLVAHVAYGLTLGAVARLRETRFIEITQKQAA